MTISFCNDTSEWLTTTVSHTHDAHAFVCASRERSQRGVWPDLHGDGELAAAHWVAILVGALPLLALQQIRMVADLAQNVNPCQCVLPVLRRERPSQTQA